MLGEITHLQAIVDDLTVLTEDPHKLPPASEQVRTVLSKIPEHKTHSCPYTCTHHTSTHAQRVANTDNQRN